MTLEEAINHCNEVANSECSECAREHRQLGEWLVELRSYREFNEDIVFEPIKKVAIGTVKIVNGGRKSTLFENITNKEDF